MEERMALIEARPEVHGGRLVFKGTRIPVDLVLEMMAAGLSFSDIIKEYPRLTKRHLEAALTYSAKVLKGEAAIKGASQS
ncbi:MAG: hypothetical protein AOA65_0424 [Candidatus Bathyarchaeota archaeon BA1]|nr:MAG: hypothetical protein AOA65_0424 [Candidatus Bathyarchaeota archaeon BA1]